MAPLIIWVAEFGQRDINANSTWSPKRDAHNPYIIPRVMQYPVPKASCTICYLALSLDMPSSLDLLAHLLHIHIFVARLSRYSNNKETGQWSRVDVSAVHLAAKRKGMLREFV
jgi:hypothetical protein